MKIYYLTLTIWFSYLTLTAQNNVVLRSKRSIDTSEIRMWPKLQNPIISNDGNFIAYDIKNVPVGNRTLIIQSIDNNWKRELVGASSAFFSSDSKKICVTIEDTLFILTLGTAVKSFIGEINSFKRVTSYKEDWIGYELKSKPNKLFLQNLSKNRLLSFDSVLNYSFSNLGNTLLLERKKDSGTFNLELVMLSESHSPVIWTATCNSLDNYRITKYCTDINGLQLAFMVETGEQNKINNSIWYYKVGMKEAVNRVNDILVSDSFRLAISSSSIEFSDNGNWLFFKAVDDTVSTRATLNLIKLDVWSYKDVILQSDQKNKIYTIQKDMALDVQTGQIIQITEKEDKIIKIKGDFLLIEESEASSQFWWKRPLNSFYLFSLKSRSKKFLLKGTKNHGYSFSFSPEAKYIVYYDQKLSQYFSYEIATERVFNLTKSIPVSFDNEYRRESPGLSFPVGIAGWSENDKFIFIYDNFDIWQINPIAKSNAVNLTNGYGLKNNIKFRFIEEPEIKGGSINIRQPIIIIAFNVQTKENGFFKVKIGRSDNPELLVMDSKYYYISYSQIPNGIPGVGTINPLKAKDANRWLLQRMTAYEAPNYIITNDFKSFIPITNFQPQKNINWYTTQLITWTQFDSTICQGILYKPENFDENKKYPIIFEYYDHRSYALNAFLQPELTDAAINIPWFVSRGYLVFRPDFHFTDANISNRTNGMNAFNTVLSAAHYLSKMPWVDSNRLGVNGHSFGGGITNYLITHTRLFAAAAEAAGVSDEISAYLDGTYGDRQQGTELGQGRRGATPWSRPDLYTPTVLKADQVTTPLLIMHNKADRLVPWSQAVEMFMALRRLNKKVWMLQYDNEGHVLGKKASLDYTVRLTQFFDYYLKGGSAPKWMLEGIPYKLKGKINGYELDTRGLEP